MAKFGEKIGLIFRARWVIFRVLTRNLEKLDPGTVFAPRECFFRILRVFHQFGLIFVRFREIWAVFGRLFSFLGRFPATLSQNMDF